MTEAVARELPEFDENGNAVDPVQKKQEATNQRRLDELGKLTERGDIEISFSSGATGTIYKCRVKHLKPVLDAVRMVYSQLGIDTIDKAANLEQNHDLNDPNFLMMIVSNSLDTVIDTLAMLTTFTRDEIEDLDLEEVTVLLNTVWRLNSDFFLKRVLPQVGSALSAKG